MTQTQTYFQDSPNNKLQMDLENTHTYAVDVEIDFTGDGNVDMGGRERPIKIKVPAASKLSAGFVNFTGEINVSWAWVEVGDD